MFSESTPSRIAGPSENWLSAMPEGAVLTLLGAEGNEKLTGLNRGLTELFLRLIAAADIYPALKRIAGLHNKIDMWKPRSEDPMSKQT